MKKCLESAVVAITVICALSPAAQAIRPLGGEFVVNTFSEGNQAGPGVAALANGGFVVVWVSGANPGGDDSGNGIVGQRLDAAGAPLGGELQINSLTFSAQIEPAVAALSDGGFVATWTNLAGPRGGTAILARVFDSSGAPLSPDVEVSEHIDDFNNQSSVASGRLGDFVVLWSEANRDRVMARHMTASGQPDAAAGVVADVGAGNAAESLAARGAGGFAAAFIRAAGGGDHNDVLARVLDAEGIAVGQELPVPSSTLGNQVAPAVAGAADGTFLVVWVGMVGDDGSEAAIFARAFSANGEARGAEVALTPLGYYAHPAIAALPGGGYLICWERGEERGADIEALVVTGTGVPVAQPFPVNTFREGTQRVPAVAVNDDEALFTWESGYRHIGGPPAGPDGSYAGIAARLFSFDPPCGDADGDERVSASDALRALQAGVAAVGCDLCLCDVDGSGDIGATDALGILMRAIGLEVESNCSPCQAVTTTTVSTSTSSTLIVDECFDDNDCSVEAGWPPGLICGGDGYHCVECDFNSDCSPGQECHGNECVTP